MKVVQSNGGQNHFIFIVIPVHVFMCNSSEITFLQRAKNIVEIVDAVFCSGETVEISSNKMINNEKFCLA